MSFQFTTENVLNDLSRVSVIDDSTTLAAPTGVTATGSGTGGTLAAATYYYKVTAVNAQGETVGSSEVNATTTGTTSSVSIAWTAVTGATSYKIYKGTTTGVYTAYFTDSASPFVDTGVAGTAGTIPTSNTAYVDNDPGVPSGDKALFIKRLNKFLASNTDVVYKRAANSSVNEVATITIPSGAQTAGVYRLALDVRTSGEYPIDFDRWAINKGKPFYIEVNMPAEASATAFVTDFVAGVKKGLIKNNGQAITDITVAASGANIVITAATDYLRFLSANVETYVTDPIFNETVYGVYATGSVTTPGVEGFGTSWYLTKNVRIPTQEATRFFGEDQDERPVIGTLYNQYIIKYSAQRNIGSLDYVGGLGVSHTDHVLWVPQTLASTFETSLTSAFGATKIVPIVG